MLKETIQRPADIIHRQIGQQALNILGAYQLSSENEGMAFSFRIKGSRKCNYIKVLLDETADTYTVTFAYKPRLTKKQIREIILSPRDVAKNITAATAPRNVVEHEGIYCDQLHDLIEQHTGLATRLF